MQAEHHNNEKSIPFTSHAVIYIRDHKIYELVLQRAGFLIQSKQFAQLVKKFLDFLSSPMVYYRIHKIMTCKS